MSTTERPSILWIGLDQMRFDTLGAHGNPICRTPNMDRLARGGADFSRAYTTCPLCTPARGSMLTGRYAFDHGMGTNCDMYHALAPEMRDPSMFLADDFRDAGYRTAWAGKWHVGAETGPGDYGWGGLSLPGYGNVIHSREFSDYLSDQGLTYTTTPEVWLNPDRQTLVAGRWNGPQESTPGHFLVDTAISLMEEITTAGNPFLMNCQFWGPHGPYMPSEEFYGLHDPAAIPEWPNWDQDLQRLPRRLARERDDFYRAHPRSWEEQRVLVARYYDMCAMIDHEIGRLLGWLEEAGLREKVIVVLASDHGDMNGSHGALQDKGFLYDDALKVPLVFSWPGTLEPSEPEDLASTMDILPTLMDLADLPIPEGLSGRTLAPALRGEPDRPRREAFLAEFHGLRFLYSQRAVITDDGWKYIFTPGDDDEMYDLNNDSWELNNLLDTQGKAGSIAGPGTVAGGVGAPDTTAHPGTEPGTEEKRRELQKRLEEVVHAEGDPLRDCVSKFFGHWYTGSGQLDATKFYDG